MENSLPNRAVLYIGGKPKRTARIEPHYYVKKGIKNPAKGRGLLQGSIYCPKAYTFFFRMSPLHDCNAKVQLY